MSRLVLGQVCHWPCCADIRRDPIISKEPCYTICYRVRTLLGAVFCGAVRWPGKGSVIWSGHCHCKICRDACPVALNSWIWLARQNITWQGTRRVYYSSLLVKRGFYLRCCAALFYDRAQRRDKTDLYAVSLDCREQFEPQAYYHYAGRQNWITLHDGLPK
jgi:hypothetical protein|uniref:CENP-V/GFA domain-containing protein n=1 Tax=uncultured marine bacterium 582 TaxID=257402 RepID=Q6SF24_9BACT|nr:conserved hypothetical protein [uncultured marine bacterium 582]